MFYVILDLGTKYYLRKVLTLLKSYELTIAGLTRLLPLVDIGNHLAVANFTLLGDAELTTTSAQQLVGQLPPVDYLVTADAKGIPLAHELARLLLRPTYIVARQSKKAYMKEPLTLAHTDLTLDGRDAQLIKDKRVILVDDIISTGESLNNLEQLVTLAGATVITRVAILAEGYAAKRKDIIYLEKLPIFDTL